MTDTKKELGQHWLKDIGILEAIAEAANLTSDDYVLEIGPGLGTLTEIIAKHCYVKALEYDQDLIAGLQSKFNDAKNVAIEQGDIRSFNFATLPADYKIVANIPYYLTSHLIRSVSETVNPPKTAVLLIQKEVAERLCSAPGQMSILAVTAQFYFTCSLDIPVAASFFTPPPKVDSQVVVLHRREKLLFDVEPKQFFRLVKAGFSEKRKTLRNALSGGLQITKDEAEQLLRTAGLDPGMRAQQLSLQQWFDLYRSFIIVSEQ